MRRTILMGVAALAFVTTTSWIMMSKRADATTAGIDIGAIHRSVDVSKLPVADVVAYQAL
jgi:hypothetical protein